MRINSSRGVSRAPAWRRKQARHMCCKSSGTLLARSAGVSSDDSYSLNKAHVWAFQCDGASSQSLSQSERAQDGPKNRAAIKRVRGRGRANDIKCPSLGL